MVKAAECWFWLADMLNRLLDIPSKWRVYLLSCIKIWQEQNILTGQLQFFAQKIQLLSKHLLRQVNTCIRLETVGNMKTQMGSWDNLVCVKTHCCQAQPQFNSISTQIKAEVSLITGISTHPSRTVVRADKWSKLIEWMDLIQSILSNQIIHIFSSNHTIYPINLIFYFVQLVFVFLINLINLTWWTWSSQWSIWSFNLIQQ